MEKLCVGFDFNKLTDGDKEYLHSMYMEVKYGKTCPKTFVDMDTAYPPAHAECPGGAELAFEEQFRHLHCALYGAGAGAYLPPDPQTDALHEGTAGASAQAEGAGAQVRQ